MAYEIVGEVPAAAIGGNNVCGILEAQDLGKAPPACPAFKFDFDSNCPLSPFDKRRRKDLCDRILGAINLAQKAASSLETTHLSPTTVSKFQIVGQGPLDQWELPWTPRRKMPAGDIPYSEINGGR